VHPPLRLARREAHGLSVDLGDHHAVAAGSGNPHLALRSGRAVDDLARGHARRQQSLAQRCEVARVEVEDDGLRAGVDLCAAWASISRAVAFSSAAQTTRPCGSYVERTSNPSRRSKSIERSTSETWTTGRGR
jgi:hypothetical protein